ncbi:element excision factor XisH family protein [Spirosoma rhododendri]|uniref:element excision factor XisH family protein n=1 Tax=Spirosoma rhododendri TaxID=2728024 RepID=UPI001C2B8E9C|nr:element excision factor XisH family protein [Spirosoma rhododendri]
MKALEKDGWRITDDPLYLKFGDRKLYVDLGAQNDTIGAEREDYKIAVEIKSFLSVSPVADMESAAGQYALYKRILALQQPDRPIYLAIPQRAYVNLFQNEFGELVRDTFSISLLIFDEEDETIIQWIP